MGHVAPGSTIFTARLFDASDNTIEYSEVTSAIGNGGRGLRLRERCQEGAGALGSQRGRWALPKRGLGGGLQTLLKFPSGTVESPQRN